MAISQKHIIKIAKTLVLKQTRNFDAKTNKLAALPATFYVQGDRGNERCYDLGKF